MVVACSIVVTCWERADLLYVIFLVTFHYGVLDQVSHDGWVALPRGAMGMSAVCDCGIS